MVAAAMSFTQPAFFPPPPKVSVTAILPPPKWKKNAPPLAIDSTALTHLQRLQADPFHGRLFEVEELIGDPSAREIIFLLPQYHRNPNFPVAWNSLGAAIGDVQENIAAVVERLAVIHGLGCIGTEGNHEERLPKSFELEQRAWWLHDLKLAKNDIYETLGAEAALVEEALDVLDVVLENAIKEQAVILDGVGSAQARLPEKTALHRFGLEDLSLNTKAQRLAKDIEEVNQALARLDPQESSAISDALGELWLKEIPLYEESTLRPYRDAMASLVDMQTLLRNDGDAILASSINRYAALARRISAIVIRPEEIDGMTDYYRTVQESLRSADAGQAPVAQRKHLSAAQRKEKKRLESRLEKLQDAYASVTYREREARAIKRVLERRKQTTNGLCALVMGANHKDGLQNALKTAFLEQKQPQALITIHTLVHE